MKRFFSLALALVASLAIEAQSVSVTGTWTVTSVVSGHESEHTCTFTQKEKDVTGTCTGERGSFANAGKVDGNKVGWQYDMEYEGQKLTPVYSGTLESAGKIVGNVNVEGMGLGGEFVATRSSAAQGPGTQAPDEAAIRAVVRNYVNARELREPAAIEALFTTAADQHTTSGEWRRGRTQVAAGSLASSTQNPGKRSITVETVRFITPDVAIADGPYVMTTGAGVRQMWTTIVLARDEGAWRIAAIRNMLPSNPGTPSR